MPPLPMGSERLSYLFVISGIIPARYVHLVVGVSNQMLSPWEGLIVCACMEVVVKMRLSSRSFFFIGILICISVDK